VLDNFSNYLMMLEEYRSFKRAFTSACVFLHPVEPILMVKYPFFMSLCIFVCKIRNKYISLYQICLEILESSRDKDIIARISEKYLIVYLSRALRFFSLPLFPFSMKPYLRP